MKYKRSNDLRSFFEEKYQGQCQQIKDLLAENTELKGEVESRDDRIRDHLETIDMVQRQMKSAADNFAIQTEEYK